MSLKDKKILVTGAAGFIGSHLVDKLLSEGANVWGIDNLSGNNLENLQTALENPNFEFRQGDIRDREFLETVMEEIDVIFHLAAFTSVKQSVLLPEQCNEINVTGTLNLLETARRFKVDKFIFSSSAAVYGDTKILPISEEIPAKPKSPYGISKLTAEQYVLLYNELYGIQTTALRYFNVYGPRQRLSEYSGVITIFLEKIRTDKDLIIYGDGNHTRDFIYISDVVTANIQASKNSPGGIMFNIATGNQISIRTLAELLLEFSENKKCKIIHKKPSTEDIIHSFADIDRARSILGFHPKWKFKDGLRLFFDWYMEKH